MKAFLKNYRQSPRKVRLVADAIRGKDVAQARHILQFADKKSSEALLKLLDSALANARSAGHTTDNLYIKEIMVDLSLMLKRSMPMARGQGSIIRHRFSRVALTLADKTANGEQQTVNSKATAEKKTSSAKATETTPKKRAVKKATSKKSESVESEKKPRARAKSAPLA